MPSRMMDDGSDVGSSASSSSSYQSPAPAPADKSPTGCHQAIGQRQRVYTHGDTSFAQLLGGKKKPDKTPNDYYGLPVGCNFCDVGFLIMWLGSVRSVNGVFESQCCCLVTENEDNGCNDTSPATCLVSTLSIALTLLASVSGLNSTLVELRGSIHWVYTVVVSPIYRYRLLQ
jgi:hypothetical protein